MPEKRMTIDLYDDGDIKVHDVANGSDLHEITEPEAMKMIQEHKIAGIVSATIVFGNPTCRWVKIGNKWYWMCW